MSASRSPPRPTARSRASTNWRCTARTRRRKTWPWPAAAPRRRRRRSTRTTRSTRSNTSSTAAWATATAGFPANAARAGCRSSLPKAATDRPRRLGPRPRAEIRRPPGARLSHRGFDRRREVDGRGRVMGPPALRPGAARAAGRPAQVAGPAAADGGTPCDAGKAAHGLRRRVPRAGPDVRPEARRPAAKGGAGRPVGRRGRGAGVRHQTGRHGAGKAVWPWPTGSPARTTRCRRG